MVGAWKSELVKVMGMEWDVAEDEALAEVWELDEEVQLGWEVLGWEKVEGVVWVAVEGEALGVVQDGE